MNSEGECFVSEHERYVVAQKLMRSERSLKWRQDKGKTEMTNVQMEISTKSEVANQATCRNTGIHHVGLHATNPVCVCGIL